MARKRSRSRGRSKKGASSRAEAEPTAVEVPIATQIWRQVSPLAWGVILALVIRALILETFWVPSGSMFPTLLIGDHVIVNKFAYGARIPFTEIRFPAVREPARGDVVIFALGTRGHGDICPLDQCPDYHSEGFVKRIVGLPGDVIELRQGALWINGEAVPVSYEGEFRDDGGQLYRLGIETLGGETHELLDQPVYPGLPQNPYTVPEGRYFVMGDNRDNSNDSRRWGTVRPQEIKGPVTYLYWSWTNPSGWLTILKPWTWWHLLTQQTRWNRFGNPVI